MIKRDTKKIFTSLTMPLAKFFGDTNADAQSVCGLANLIMPPPLIGGGIKR